jgi:hypothetical protein
VNVQIELPDGKKINSKGNQRYHVVRITLEGGYKARGSESAENAVIVARQIHVSTGFKLLVVDTKDGEIIATYPKDLTARAFPDD